MGQFINLHAHSAYALKCSSCLASPESSKSSDSSTSQLNSPFHYQNSSTNHNTQPTSSNPQMKFLHSFSCWLPLLSPYLSPFRPPSTSDPQCSNLSTLNQRKYDCNSRHGATSSYMIPVLRGARFCFAMIILDVNLKDRWLEDI